MRHQGLACLLALFAATSAHARTPSAARTHGEDFNAAKARYLGDRASFARGTPGDAAATIDQVDQSKAVSWDKLGSFDAVTRAFEEVRDARFLKSWFKPKFIRRISWLYPDDGCWARAASADLKYAELNYPMPSKVFAFGNLEVKTKNSPFGAVAWWYHVAPVISFGGTAYVLDAAIEPKHPLPLTEWVAIMSDPQARVAICAPGTFDPGSDCEEPDPKDNEIGPLHERGYLFWEWLRLFVMGRKPAQELGDHPPW